VTGRAIYLKFNRADTGWIGPTRLPRDYVLACRFFHCGIMDRTRTLDQGFDYRTLDPIPPPAVNGPAFAELCDRTGAALVAEALETGQRIHVVWSGGIDSTTALIAVMSAASAVGRTEVVRIAASYSSVQENPRFFRQHIAGKYPVDPVLHPIWEFLDGSALNVTGEHGDQLFRSQLLESYVRRGLAATPYQEILPFVLLEQLGNPVNAFRVSHYLRPVIAAAPVPIHTLFDYLWWLNFALKWQDVTLRLAAPRGSDARAVFGSLRHFFRSQEFQAWSLANPSIRRLPVWTNYKETAKRYILDFTGDHDYYHTKEKEDSLRNVLADPNSERAFRAHMNDDFQPIIAGFTPTQSVIERAKERFADWLA
jgi:hypothetical protein